MIENSKPRLEDAPEGEDVSEDGKQKISFPILGVIILGSIFLLMIACIIVIACLKAAQ